MQAISMSVMDKHFHAFMAKLSAVGIHRLYILSGKGHTPEGTVALGDILKYLRHGWA